MLPKDSAPYLKNRQPHLAAHYAAACKKVYGCKPFVQPKLFPKFRVFEDDLREQHISSKEYAYTVTKLLEKFVASKKWKYLPCNLFLSDYALKRYKQVQATETVSICIDDNKTILFHDELLVARLFIDKNVATDGDFHRWSEIVDELTPMLSDTWLQVYVNKGKRPTMDVIDVLMTEFHISKPVNSYLDIIGVLR